MPETSLIKEKLKAIPSAYLAIIILVIIVVFYKLSTFHSNSYEKYLTGLWVGDSGFCEEADIDSMLIYFGEPEKEHFWSKQERNGYVIMRGATNQAFTIRYRKGWSSPFIGKYCLNADIEFEQEDIMPETVKIIIDISNGTLKIYEDDVLYGVLYKNHEVSQIFNDE